MSFAQYERDDGLGRALRSKMNFENISLITHDLRTVWKGSLAQKIAQLLYQSDRNLKNENLNLSREMRPHSDCWEKKKVCAHLSVQGTTLQNRCVRWLSAALNTRFKGMPLQHNWVDITGKLSGTIKHKESERSVKRTTSSRVNHRINEFAGIFITILFCWLNQAVAELLLHFFQVP